jgi:hypothetical protein
MTVGPLLGNHALHRFVVSLYIDTAVTGNVPTEGLAFSLEGYCLVNAVPVNVKYYFTHYKRAPLLE